MKKVIISVSVILLSNSLYAQNIDSKKVCVYANQIYSAGSVTLMDNKKMICVKEHELDENTNLIWVETSKLKQYRNKEIKESLYNSPAF